MLNCYLAPVTHKCSVSSFFTQLVVNALSAPNVKFPWRYILWYVFAKFAQGGSFGKYTSFELLFCSLITCLKPHGFCLCQQTETKDLLESNIILKNVMLFYSHGKLLQYPDETKSNAFCSPQ